MQIFPCLVGQVGENNMDNSFSYKITKSIPLSDLQSLYMQEGWSDEKDTQERLQKIIDGSFLVVGCFLNKKMIGFGRVISDGVSDGYLQDIIVDQQWRGHHIGKKIVSLLTNTCQQMGINWLFLISVPTAIPFYQKLNWQELKGYQPMKAPNNGDHGCQL